MEVAVFGPHTRVVEASGAAVRLGALTVLVLQEVAQRAVKHPRSSSDKGSRVLASSDTTATSLDADQAHGRIIGKGIEHADGVAAAAYARQHEVGKSLLSL